jgi:hypothetical protein
MKTLFALLLFAVAWPLSAQGPAYQSYPTLAAVTDNVTTTCSSGNLPAASSYYNSGSGQGATAYVQNTAKTVMVECRSNGTNWIQIGGSSSAGVSSFNTRTGAVTLSSGDVTTALTYTPAASTAATTVNGVSCALSNTCAPYGGTNAYTTNHTVASSDIGKLIAMNCGSACALTLSATPGANDFFWVQSVGGTVATINLNGTQYNFGTTAPALGYGPVFIISDGTNYRGDTPPVAGTNVTLTPTQHGVTIAASGSGGSLACELSGAGSFTCSTLNFIPGTGLLLVQSNSPTGTMNLTPSIDTGVVQTLSNEQAGVATSVAATGSATGNLLASVNPNLTTYTQNQTFSVEITDGPSHGADNLNINSVGPVAIFKMVGTVATAIAAGDIQQDKPTILRYTTCGIGCTGGSGGSAGFLFSPDGAIDALVTGTNCSSVASPAACASAAAGNIAFPTGVTSVVLTVNTTAVTANSQIFLFPDDSLGTKLGITCNSTLATLVGGMAITARSAGTSFTATYNGTIAANALCASYLIVN